MKNRGGPLPGFSPESGPNAAHTCCGLPVFGCAGTVTPVVPGSRVREDRREDRRHRRPASPPRAPPPSAPCPPRPENLRSKRKPGVILVRLIPNVYKLSGVILVRLIRNVYKLSGVMVVRLIRNVYKLSGVIVVMLIPNVSQMYGVILVSDPAGGRARGPLRSLSGPRSGG